MPWESKAQQRWGHSPAGEEALGGPAKVHEWDEATKGHFGSLPEKTMNKGHLSKTERFAEGGAVLGRTKNFLKQGDGEDQHSDKKAWEPYMNPDAKEQEYGKQGSPSHLDDVPNRRKGGKVLKPFLPRS